MATFKMFQIFIFFKLKFPIGKYYFNASEEVSQKCITKQLQRSRI